jgi:hypothetical protein
MMGAGRNWLYVPEVVSADGAPERNGNVRTMKKSGMLVAVVVGLMGVWVPRAAAAPVTISHSVSLDITGTLNCMAQMSQPETSFYRVFDLPDFGIDGQFTVSSVDVAVGDSLAPSGSQPMTVNLYTLTGPFVLANLTLIGSSTVNVADGVTATIINVPVLGVAPPGSTLVVERLSPDGMLTGNSLSIGLNSLGETGPGYIRCGSLVEPIPVSDLGPLLHIVMQVHGDALPPAAGLCRDPRTGALSAPLGASGCPAGTRPVSVGGAQPTQLCINRSTGGIFLFPGRPCPQPTWLAHTVPDDGPLAYCVNRSTSKLRYSPSGACTANEVPGVIPGV